MEELKTAAEIRKSAASKQLKIDDQDYEKIKMFIAEHDIGSNAKFMHLVAENLDLLRALFDGDDRTSDTASPSPSEPKSTGVYFKAEGESFPSVFPTPDWEVEDRKRWYSHIFNNSKKYGVNTAIFVRRAYDERPYLPEDIFGNPKIKTKYGYMTRNYINEHGWLVCPELYPEKTEELKCRNIIFDDMDSPEKEKEILELFPPAPVGGTLQVRRWVRDGGKERAAALTDNELPVERRGI